MGIGFVCYYLPESQGNPVTFSIGLCFHAGILDSVSVVASDSASRSSWDDWSEQGEMVRAKQTEEWFMQQGYATGHYSWGEIWSGYDVKSAAGGGGVRYLNSEQTAAGNGADAPHLS